MAQILVRGLKPDLIKRLKMQAARNGRSLESEARKVLEAGTTYSMDEARAVLEKWQKHWGDRTFSDSVEIIREGRER